MQQVDGYEPDCLTGSCVIPPLDDDGQRIMGLRALIVSLDGLVDAGTILTMAEADLNDLALLAEVETLLKTTKDGHGEGR